MLHDRAITETKPAVEFAVESISVIRDEAMPIVVRHYDEIAQFKQVQKLDPDWGVYLKAEEAGKLWVMTARRNGEIVGYIIMLLTFDMHYRKMFRATEDVHFLIPEYRKGLLGYRMLAKTKQAMANKGCKTITFRTKADADHGKLFERLGGVLHDLVYTIVIGDSDG